MPSYLLENIRNDHNVVVEFRPISPFSGVTISFPQSEPNDNYEWKESALMPGLWEIIIATEGLFRFEEGIDYPPTHIIVLHRDVELDCTNHPNIQFIEGP
jgi:hypothetical protein